MAHLDAAGGHESSRLDMVLAPPRLGRGGQGCRCQFGSARWGRAEVVWKCGLCSRWVLRRPLASFIKHSGRKVDLIQQRFMKHPEMSFTGK